MTYGALGAVPQLGYLGIPLALSRLGRRHGWRGGRPGRANLVGLAILLGSVPAAAGGVAWFTGVTTAGVPFEERVLERRVGASYDAYRSRVPRWLSRRRRTASAGR